METAEDSPDVWLHNLGEACKDIVETSANDETSAIDLTDDAWLGSEDEDGSESDADGGMTDGDAFVERDGTRHRSVQMWRKDAKHRDHGYMRDKPKVGKRGIGFLPSQARVHMR